MMRIYKNKSMIRKRLIESLTTGEGIRLKTTSVVVSRYYHLWLTGTEDNFIIRCYSIGEGLSAQSGEQSHDYPMQDLEKIVSYLWQLRADIIEDK